MCIFLTEADPLDFDCFSLLLLEQLMFTLEILEHLRSFVPDFAISSCQNGFSFLAEYSEAFFTLFTQSVFEKRHETFRASFRCVLLRKSP